MSLPHATMRTRRTPLTPPRAATEVPRTSGHPPLTCRYGLRRPGRTYGIDLRIRCSCLSPCSPEDSGVIWCGLGLHHPVQRPCFDFLLEPDCCVLITGCEPVTEPHAGEALVAEQYGHALSRAVAGDDDLGVVVHPFDEGQALPGRFREPIGLLNRPAAAEEVIDAGTLSLQLC